MKKRHGLLLKTTLFLSALILLTAVFTAVLLEPRFRIYGWEELDAAKLIKTEKTVEFLDAVNENIDNPVYDYNKTYVALQDVPRHTVDAFVSIEDKRFYRHHGVDYKRIMGALWNNIRTFSFKEGASTISQQLIKNTHLSGDKKISRKIKEIRIAKDLERNYSKDEIMEMYLNMLYFGDNIYGINTAANVFFNTTPAHLSVAQSACLAGIINNPYKYNPYRNAENSVKRRNLVLSEMHKNGKLDEHSYHAAISEPLTVYKDKNYTNQYLNSVIKDAQKILGLSRKEFLSKKLTVGTYYEKELESGIRAILKRETFPEDTDAHVVVLRNGDGQLLADVSLKNVNLSELRRQPGSTIKPFLCYAPALEQGDTYCCSPIEDKKQPFGSYRPSNYNDVYHGWTTVEDALSLSLNIPAVQLLQNNGIDYSKSVCEQFGIDFAANDDNLALALGGMTYGVTLRQLADGYQAFANEGKFVSGSAIRYIRDEKGRILYSRKKTERQAVSADTAYLMNTMLKKCAKEGTAKKLRHFDNVCAKTGTVGGKDGNSDIYCLAYSPRYTVGVWAGSDKKMPNNLSAGNVAAGIAREIFLRLNDTADFVKPETVVSRYIDLREREANQKILLAGLDVPLKDKTSAWFSLRHMPTEYSTRQTDEYFRYDDFLNLDFDNFKIIEDFFD